MQLTSALGLSGDTAANGVADGGVGPIPSVRNGEIAPNTAIIAGFAGVLANLEGTAEQPLASEVTPTISPAADGEDAPVELAASGKTLPEHSGKTLPEDAAAPPQGIPALTAAHLSSPIEAKAPERATTSQQSASPAFQPMPAKPGPMQEMADAKPQPIQITLDAKIQPAPDSAPDNAIDPEAKPASKLATQLALRGIPLDATLTSATEKSPLTPEIDRSTATKNAAHTPDAPPPRHAATEQTAFAKHGGKRAERDVRNLALTPSAELAPATKTSTQARADTSVQNGPLPSASPPIQPALPVSAQQPSNGPAQALSSTSFQPAGMTQAHDFDAVVQRLAEARETARSGEASMRVLTREFGHVAMQFELAGRALKVSLASQDANFAPAVQAALAERAPLGLADSGRSETSAGRHDQGPHGQSGHQSGSGPAGQQPQRQSEPHNGQAQHSSKTGDEPPAVLPGPESQEPNISTTQGQGLFA